MVEKKSKSKFKHELLKLAKTKGLPSPEIVEETETIIKARIRLTQNALIDIRFNDVLQELRSALIVNNARVFGMNGEPGDWHIHQLNCVDKHEKISEKSLDDMLGEYLAIIAKLHIGSRHAL